MTASQLNCTSRYAATPSPRDRQAAGRSGDVAFKLQPLRPSHCWRRASVTSATHGTSSEHAPPAAAAPKHSSPAHVARPYAAACTRTAPPAAHEITRYSSAACPVDLPVAAAHTTTRCPAVAGSAVGDAVTPVGGGRVAGAGEAPAAGHAAQVYALVAGENAQWCGCSAAPPQAAPTASRPSTQREASEATQRETAQRSRPDPGGTATTSSAVGINAANAAPVPARLATGACSCCAASAVRLPPAAADPHACTRPAASTAANASPVARSHFSARRSGSVAPPPPAPHVSAVPLASTPTNPEGAPNTASNPPLVRSRLPPCAPLPHARTFPSAVSAAKAPPDAASCRTRAVAAALDGVPPASAEPQHTTVPSSFNAANAPPVAATDRTPPASSAATVLASPPPPPAPQATTEPSSRTAANAVSVADSAATVTPAGAANSAWTDVLSPPSSACPQVTTAFDDVSSAANAERVFSSPRRVLAETSDATVDASPPLSAGPHATMPVLFTATNASAPA
eukprot:gene14984-biopygen15055